MVGTSQEEETGGAKSSRPVFGDSFPKPVVESEPSREDRLISLIFAEKDEKKGIRQEKGENEVELKNQIEQMKKAANEEREKSRKYKAKMEEKLENQRIIVILLSTTVILLVRMFSKH